MTHQKTVVIDIGPDGSSSVDLQNFHGKGCAKVLAEFQGGDEAKEISHKREYQECERPQEVRIHE